MESLQKNILTPSKRAKERQKTEITKKFNELLAGGCSKTAARYLLMEQFGKSYSNIVKLTK